MKKTIRLRLGIATVFAALTVFLILVMVGYLYVANSKLALKTATQSMDRSGAEIVKKIRNLFDPVTRVVDAIGLITKLDSSAVRTVRGLKFFHQQIEALPQIYGLYVGFKNDGSFYQVVHLNSHERTFGPISGLNGEIAVRLLDDSSGIRADSFIFMKKWGEITRVERGPVTFDPRRRPWFEGVQKRDPLLSNKVIPDRVFISDPYPFSSTGNLGITLSKPVLVGNKKLLAVVGADIKLDHLAGFLDDLKVGQHGIIAVLDKNNDIIVRSDAEETRSNLKENWEDVVLKAVIKQHDKDLSEKFSLTEPTSGNTYLANFYSLPKTFSKSWKVVIIADQDEFIRDIKQTSINISIVAFGIVCLAVFLIVLLSRTLSTPIQKVVEEAGKIQRFALEGDFKISSRITEVHELTKAVENMKNSLKSFAAYVPKLVVQDIVSSGREVKIGGESRLLTILFSDIKSFTNKSEKMHPEDIFSDLSTYFSTMSDAITDHNGTVDSFIGDAVMALWNAPNIDDNHAVNACRAVLACRRECEKINANAGLHKGLFPVETRFGLHSGEVIVGNVGSSDRMQYTALGPSVNLASRIEAINKTYGTDILITGSVEERVNGVFVLRLIDTISPAGTSIPIVIYELIGEEDEASVFNVSEEQRAKIRHWCDVYDLYQAAKWQLALSQCQLFLERYPGDKVALEYRKRCENFVINPPPADWDGVQNYTQK